MVRSVESSTNEHSSKTAQAYAETPLYNWSLFNVRAMFKTDTVTDWTRNSQTPIEVTLGPTEI